MKFFVSFLTFSLFFIICPLTANAKFIIEERDEALNRTIFAPENVKPATKSGSDISVDYKKSLSQKFFAAFPEVILVDIEEPISSIAQHEGKFIAVRLIEPNNTSWTFEKNFDNLVFVKKEKRNDVVILLYQTVKTGEAKLTFDLMKEDRALLSRILNVKVI